MPTQWRFSHVAALAATATAAAAAFAAAVAAAVNENGSCCGGAGGGGSGGDSSGRLRNGVSDKDVTAPVPAATAPPSPSLLSLRAEASVDLPLRVDLPAGLTPGGFATAYSNGEMYFVSDAADGSLWVGNYSGGPAVQLPASVGVPGRRLYGIDYTPLVDVVWAAGGSANGSGIGYALDGATGATLATYVFAPGNTASFVGTVSGHGRYRAVFADAGVAAVYSVVHGLDGWNPSFGPADRVEQTFERVPTPAASSAVSYVAAGISSSEEVELVAAATGESYYTSGFDTNGGVRQWQSRGLGGTARALTGATGIIGFGSLGDPVLIARASAGVLSVLRQPFDGSPTVVVNGTAAGIIGPVAIEYVAGGGVFALNRDPAPPPPPPAAAGAASMKALMEGGVEVRGAWDAYGVYGGGYADCAGAKGGGGSSAPTVTPTATPTAAPPATPSAAATVAPEASPTAMAGASPPPPGLVDGTISWSLVAVPAAVLDVSTA